MSSSLQMLPKLNAEINIHISNFLNHQKITAIGIKKCARDIKELAMINKDAQKVVNEKLADLKILFELVEKYKAYNQVYERNGKNGEANPHLLDALFTGWSGLYGQHTFSVFTQDTERDIKELVRLTPQCLESKEGQMRLFGNLTPLFVACVNKKIPVHIVKFLLESGADAFAPMDSQQTPIYKAIFWTDVIESKTRAKEVQELFMSFLVKKNIAMSMSKPYNEVPDELVKNILKITLHKPSSLWLKGPKIKDNL